jgi:hypothetical protein
LLGLVWTAALVDDTPHRDLTEPAYAPLADEDEDKTDAPAFPQAVRSVQV